MPSAQGSLRRTMARSLLLATTAMACAVAVGPAHAAPQLVGCKSAAQTLGVERIVEVDTSAGPHFGHQQYKDIELLAPGEVVLTFDDGPSRHTRPILDALDAQCTKATFFMVGSQAVGDPEMVRDVIRRGHTVGTHTWSHANLRRLTPLKARQEIELGVSAVAAAAGQPISPFFRFPYLADTKSMLGYTQTRTMGIFSIEIDSQDWKTKNAASIHRDVLAQLAEAGKGIILFHDIQPATMHALPGLLEALRAKGYKVVHLKPKAMGTTLPEFDAMARDVKARNMLVASEHPMARRSMTWGAAQPAVMARAPQTPGVANVPGQATATAAFPTGPRGAGTTTMAVRGPNVPAPIPGTYGTPAAGASVYGSTTAPVGEPAAQPYARVARQRPPIVEDWRDKVFSR